MYKVSEPLASRLLRAQQKSVRCPVKQPDIPWSAEQEAAADAIGNFQYHYAPNMKPNKTLIECIAKVDGPIGFVKQFKHSMSDAPSIRQKEEEALEALMDALVLLGFDD